jgi:hypothetical protein
MELIVLILIAGAVGYFLAGSRYSKPIDDTAGKVTDTTKGWGSRFSNWWGARFGRRQKSETPPAEQVVDVPASTEEKKPAEKSPSRRKSEGAEGEGESPLP